MNHPSKLFNVGQYRRNIVGSGVGHDFWDPLNQESYAQRGQIAQQCLEDAFISLEKNECSCAVFDATNCTLEVRKLKFIIAFLNCKLDSVVNYSNKQFANVAAMAFYLLR